MDSSTRLTGLAYYEINFKSNYNAVAFDVDAWDPAVPGPALVEIEFADGTEATVAVFQTSHHEDLPVFFGIVADRFIKRLRWNETPEIDGTGNEEVALDDLSVGNTLSVR